MTPKEKAEDLYFKYRNYAKEESRVEGPHRYAKICASRCVDEIIFILQNMEWVFADRKAIYWLEVKKEIENL